MSSSIIWPNLPDTDLNCQAMVIYDAAVNGGRGGYRPLDVVDLLNIGGASSIQAFVTNLTSGATGQFISFPTNFTSIPVVAATIVGNTGILAHMIVNKSTSGYLVAFSAAVPNSSYAINTIAK
jgi:hypothetical protein